MITDLALGTSALLLLVFPGWLWARTHGLRLPILAGFISGAIGLVLLIQSIDAVGLPLSTRTVLCAWLAILLGVVLATKRVTPPQAVPSNWFWRTEWRLMLCLIPAVAVVAYRATAQALFGLDTAFRWNFLAEQMLARGTIAFYPPVTGADYEIYAWPDGIAPLVSSLYFWSYSLAGVARPVLTSPLVISQFLLLLATVHALARQLGSPRAATITCALVACSPVILWSTAMGQESGLIALSLLAMLLYLPTSRETADTPTTLLAGLAAAMGGLAREYGLAFIFFGLALGLVRRLSVRTLSLYLLAALIGALPWHLRNWLHTGNPLFNHNLAGIFPVNAGHIIYQQTFGWNQLPSGAPRIFATNCLVSVVGGIVGTTLCFKSVRPLFAAVILVAGLWVISLGFTATGFTYSLRFLAPALLIGTVIGGLQVAQWVPGRKHMAGLSLALLVFACDAALRTLALPSDVYRHPPANWLDVGGAIHDYQRRPVYRELARYAADRRILVLGPTALLNQNGARTVPLWSPAVDYLWTESLTPTEAARRMTADGIDFVLLNKGEVNNEYLAKIAFFRHGPSLVLQSVWEDDDMTLFKVITAPSRPTSPGP